MCGICGYAGAVPPQTDLVRMTRILAHRGPDDEGFYRTENVGIGHRRLAIIDLKDGSQPMSSPCGRYVIAYNGEIYNYLSLCKQLKDKGVTFRTRSDTEVLLHWLCEYGIAGLASLNGMFAFAFWDNETQSLLLVRDRLGIKPLYIYSESSHLYFSSEIKAILPFLDSVEANFQTIYEFLTYQNVLSSASFFKGIRKLLPGHWLIWTPMGLREGAFWTMYQQEDPAMTFPDAVNQYKLILQSAVTRHMIADVTVGAYLSGGLDSSSVAMMAAPQLRAPLHTFTGAFCDAPYYDERVGSRAVAHSLGAVVHEVEITPYDFVDNFHRVIYHLDEPTLGTGAVPQFIVSRLVSQHVKVVLTGHGGDELFAGYQVNKAMLLRQLWGKGFQSFLSALLGVKRDELSRVLYYLLFPLASPEVGYGLFVMTPRRQRNTFFSQEFLTEHQDFEPLDLVRNLAGMDQTSGQSLIRLYLTTYLPTLFVQEDKMSMAHSIEARTPLCDNELVDFALSCPLNIKLWENRLKAIPRAAMRDVLPSVLYSLPKRGFPTPFARWFRKEPLKSYIADLVSSNRLKNRSIFNPKALTQLLDRNNRSSTDNLHDYARANKIYSIAAVELWFRTFIDAQSINN